MDFKKTFIDLTQWVVPHGYEETIAHLLPEGCQKDKKGNYFITIGESETLFTCHLDTVSQRAKVNHVFEDNWIKTDGTTILGGDNKAGVCILMYLIEQNVPGTYFFFIGEECGRIGSKWALENDADFFKKFKRAIAFDRRNRGSIITHQSSRLCASPEFTESLSKEMAKSGLEYKGDSGGSYTDTYTFIDVISECTNLSASVVGEHTSSEKVDIVHLEEIAKAASKVEWEKLPSSRDFNKKEWKSYGSSTYSGNTNYNYGYGGYGYGEYEDYYQVNLPQPPKKNVSESGLEFTIQNVDKFFNLKKVECEDICFTTLDGKRTFYFNFEHNLVAFEEDLGQKYPYIQQHYVQKLPLLLPKSFEELWKFIEPLNLPFKPKIDQTLVPYYGNYISEYFDLQEVFDDHGNRIFIDPKTHREFQFEIDSSWIGVWEILNVEPYVKPIYSNDNNFKSFVELWIDIREYVPFRRKGLAENTFYNGGSKIKTYNKIVNVTNDSVGIAFKEENIDKFFDLVKIKGEKSEVEYYKSPNGEKSYFIEISPIGKVYLWEKESGKASILNGVSFLTFDQMWNSIKDKVEFKPIGSIDDLDKILAELDRKKTIPFKNDNVENYFTLTNRNVSGGKKNGNKGFYFLSENENKTSYFFKLMEDDNTVYLVDLSGEISSGSVRSGSSPHVLLNYEKFNSFDEVWEAIKDKVDFKPRPKEKIKPKYEKVEFNNDGVTKVFDLIEYSRRDKHYETKDGLRYYFDIIDNISGSKDVYLWERTPGHYKTIIDGSSYESFAELWLDIELHVKFKKKVPYIQDNVTLYFDLIADIRSGGFYHSKDGGNFYIHCGKGRNKVAIKQVYYKDDGTEQPKTGLKRIDKMENLYFGGNELESFDELWEIIKDKVPFKRR